METRYKNDELTQEEINKFDLTPYGERLCIKEIEVAQIGRLIVPDGSREVRTTEGYIIAVGEAVKGPVIGDKVYYGQYSGLWVTRNNIKYRLMNQEDLLGKVKVNGKRG